MAESEEGQQMLSQLFTAFQESKQTGNSQMFKKGGKMAAFVNKYGNGGCVSCKKKEILQGGMVNKMAEKMQDGGDAPKISRRDAIRAGMSRKGYTREQASTALANAMNTGRNMGLRGRELRQWARQGFVPNTPEIDLNVEVPTAPELEQVPIGKFVFDNNSINPTVDVIPQTFNQAFRGARKNNLKEFTWNGKRYTTELAPEAPEAPEIDLNVEVPKFEDPRLLNYSFNFSNGILNPTVEKIPITHSSANSRGLVRGMDLGFLFNRRKMQKGGELATMTSAETANNIGLIPMAQKGNQMPSNNPNQIAENTVLSILSSPRPFVQQNVTPTETREFYAYDRNRLPDNVGGPFNFEGAIRTITPSDTTITYQIPNQGIYGVASSKNRGSNWGFINSSMDKIKDKANKQNK